jgi:hypothetical protein
VIDSERKKPSLTTIEVAGIVCSNKGDAGGGVIRLLVIKVLTGLDVNSGFASNEVERTERRRVDNRFRLFPMLLD